jgi:uncharacterized protein
MDNIEMTVIWLSISQLSEAMIGFNFPAITRPAIGISLFLAFIPLSGTVDRSFAAAPTASPSLKSSGAPQEKTLMWEVSGKDLKQPSYLYGTIHINCKNRLALSPKRQELFAKTKQLYLELDFDDPQMQNEITKYTQMPPGKNLRQLITAKEYQKAQKFFAERLKISLDFFTTTKPFILTAIATPTGLKCSTSSWEEALTKVAQQRKIEVKGLETVKEQFAVFDNISLKQEAAMLMEVINDPDKSQKDFQQLLAAYDREDIPLLEKLSKADRRTQKLTKALLDDRNRKWIPKIAKIAKTQPTFFGFGAAHLVGKQGVIALLRKAGYSVKPISKS